MGLLTKPIYASEALSAYVILDNELTEELSAIREDARRAQRVKSIRGLNRVASPQRESHPSLI